MAPCGFHFLLLILEKKTCNLKVLGCYYFLILLNIFFISNFPNRFFLYFLNNLPPFLM